MFYRLFNAKYPPTLVKDEEMSIYARLLHKINNSEKMAIYGSLSLIFLNVTD